MRDIVIAALLVFLAGTASAHAYIDPGSGSVLTTAIIGFFAAIAYTCRKYFYKLKDALLGRSSQDKAEGKRR